MKKRIVIADILSNTINGKQTGHYFALARNYLNLFGDNCIVAGGPVYTNAFSPEELLLLPYNNNEGDGQIKLRLRIFANARHLLRSTKDDIIVLQQCTTITSFLCVLLFYHRKSKLFFIQYNQSGLRQLLGRLLWGLVKPKIDGIICPNEMVGKAYGIPYCVVPDYIYSGQDAIMNRSYDEMKYDFCMIGRISEEKGIVEAARFLANTPYKVLIAGRPITNELEQELLAVTENAPNIELHLGFISEENYKLFLQESRYTILNYQGEYSQRSSGVVYDTLFAGVPVLGCQCKALQFIKDYGMGSLFNDINDFDFKKVLNVFDYNNYIGNIKSYCLTHKEYKRHLNEFLLK